MTKLEAIKESKTLRRTLDDLLQVTKEFKKHLIRDKDDSKEFEDLSEVIAQVTLSQRDIEAAIMRQGMALKYIGQPDPYPESKNPESSVVEKTADGLKM